MQRKDIAAIGAGLALLSAPTFAGKAASAAITAALTPKDDTIDSWSPDLDITTPSDSPSLSPDSQRDDDGTDGTAPEGATPDETPPGETTGNTETSG